MTYFSRARWLVAIVAIYGCPMAAATPPPTICYVTTNACKIAEASLFLEKYAPPFTLEFVDLDIPESQTTDVVAIAQEKARYAWERLRRPLLVDDSGIYFNRWKNFPGTLSKFVAQTLGMEGVARLIDEGDTGYFLLYLVYVDEAGSQQVFEGRCDGILLKSPRGDVTSASPFRSIFKPEGLELTYEQIAGDPAYADYFHRVRALKQLVEYLVTQRGA